jgi:hypothetical protein
MVGSEVQGLRLVGGRDPFGRAASIIFFWWILSVIIGCVWLSMHETQAMSLAQSLGWILEDNAPGPVKIATAWLFTSALLCPCGIVIGFLGLMETRRNGASSRLSNIAMLAHGAMLLPWTFMIYEHW